MSGVRSKLAASIAAVFLMISPAGAQDSAATTPADEPGLGADEGADEALMELALRPWTGDLDAMIERRVVRVLVAYDKIFYFVDNFQQRGFTYELMRDFEAKLNKSRKLKGPKAVHVFYIPVTRDRLITGLVDGMGDIAASNITITPERQALVDFSTPFTEQVKEVLVTAADYPDLAAPEELSGREVVVRRSSSFYESLEALNARLEEAGEPPVEITLADEALEDDALAELVSAGVYPPIVMDRYEALLWVQVFPKLKVQEAVVLREGGAIAWAFRKDSPQLAEAVNGFIKRNRVGSLLTNILVKRYIQNTSFVEEALSPEEQEKFQKTIEIFKKYADEYDFNWLLLIAQGYQESKLDQSAVSNAGAVGLMQLLPSTAAGDPINIANIKTAENNVHAGAKYMRYLIDSYFSDPAISPLDRQLLATAAYNAGPNRIQSLRQRAAKEGLDPNRWFNNVELIVASKVGRQPVDYVANIFKYYVAYNRIEERKAQEEAAKIEQEE